MDHITITTNISDNNSQGGTQGTHTMAVKQKPKTKRKVTTNWSFLLAQIWKMLYSHLSICPIFMPFRFQKCSVRVSSKVGLFEWHHPKKKKRTRKWKVWAGILVLETGLQRTNIKTMQIRINDNCRHWHKWPLKSLLTCDSKLLCVTWCRAISPTTCNLRGHTACVRTPAFAFYYFADY